jgi:hypothetical protein
MAELFRTTDIVLLTYVNSLLCDAGIPVHIADGYVSAVEGSIGAFPRRVLVPSGYVAESISVLSDAGLSHHLAHELKDEGRSSKRSFQPGQGMPALGLSGER